VGEGLLSTAPAVVAEAVWEDPNGLFEDAGLERGADGVLRMSGLSLDAIAADVGTPAYLYHAPSIRRRYRELTAAFAALPAKVYFAVKANGNLAVLRLLRELGAGADIVSVGELARARAAGFEPRSIVFSGVGKGVHELAAAIEVGVGSINLESAEELSALEQLVAGRDLREPVRLGIRVNPDVAADTHPYITTGASGIKFGVPAEQVPLLASRVAANPRFKLVNLAMHLGSQILDPAPIVAGAEKLRGLLDTVRRAGIGTVEALDVGGGLGIRYQDETPLSPDALAAGLSPILAGAGVSLHLEPGRYLIGSAGVLLTRVLFRKQSGGKHFVIVDAAMNDLVRPSHYQAHHAIVEVTRHRRGVRIVDVVGPVCETGDFLALDRPLPMVEPGETLAILCAGAYGFTMASNYNTRPRPPEVLVDRGRYGVARPRETIESMLAAEKAEPFA
jgi:diaminopimelate decarboxylase